MSPKSYKTVLLRTYNSDRKTNTSVRQHRHDTRNTLRRSAETRTLSSASHKLSYSELLYSAASPATVSRHRNKSAGGLSSWCAAASSGEMAAAAAAAAAVPPGSHSGSRRPGSVGGAPAPCRPGNGRTPGIHGPRIEKAAGAAAPGGRRPAAGSVPGSRRTG